MPLIDRQQEWKVDGRHEKPLPSFKWVDDQAEKPLKPLPPLMGERAKVKHFVSGTGINTRLEGTVLE